MLSVIKICIDEVDDENSDSTAKLFQCTKCGQSFPDNNALESHKKTHLFCEICNESFHFNYELECHRKIHTAMKSSKCDICGMTFTCRCYLSNDERQRVKKSTYETPEVHAENYVISKDLTECSKVLSNKRFNCTLCEKSFARKSFLLKHSLYEHADSHEKVYLCKLCQEPFLHLRHLQFHMANHPDKPKYVCVVCGKAFFQEDNLINHKRIHANEKPFLCSICDKRFISSKACSRHMKGHDDENVESDTDKNRKKYSDKKCAVRSAVRKRECELCGKLLAGFYSLQRHRMLHTGEKPYECEICNVCFSSTKSLKRHRLSHTKEKPYECEVCGKGFSVKYNMDLHYKIHSGEKPFKCEICGKCFRVKCVLQCHLKKVHK